MYGWNGKFLRVDLTRRKAVAQQYNAQLAHIFLGGRGFAIKILWDELKPGIDPFSPENKLVIAAGPLTGFPLVSSGKLVVATKSPLTGGYGDGNIGTNATVKMRRAGYDAIIIEGKAENPSLLLVEDDKTEILSAKDLWRLGTFETEKEVKKEYGKTAGVISIGPGGENLVKFANIVSQEGRGGGRPGIGAVMGSKNLKTIAIIGSGIIPAADMDELKTIGTQTYREILRKPNYKFWKRQGTMSTIEWSQENSVLPTQNYREGIFENAADISGFAMEKIKILNRGCPNCNMTCGNVVKDANGESSELDYENVAMLGSNINLGDLKKVATLNRLADEYGIDTISLGNTIAFAMEASEKKLIDYKIEWGDYEEAETLARYITYKQGPGLLLSEGVRTAATRIGGNSQKWAMHIKGLEISAYDCHVAPAMALAYGTAAAGAHHKDAWVISWEVEYGRDRYDEAKVDKVIELQRLRGGMFECLTTCRLPWVEVGFELEWYPKYMKAATGLNLTMDKIYTIADRIYALIRAFWVREYNNLWSKEMDTPPARWFEEPLTKGNFKGAKLDKEKYEVMLQMYYQKRGWDNRGVPMKKTLAKLGLQDAITELSEHIQLTA
ncbi:MAG: aldehyde ferredoxin oxidoreductase family protein [Candidatus Bathyarchaeota archaeon]|nr:aldehyde ferredoxin oxidoreductase family protein [Candidatus Bathyarchaeota archaeon]